jgi:M6 family metalloprotease-like protein
METGQTVTWSPTINLRRATAAIAMAASSAGGTAASAQTDVEAVGRALGGAVPPPAYYAELARNPRAFQFSDDNGWIRKGRSVAGVRNAARAAAAGGNLFLAPQASFAGGVMQGDLNVPAFLALYANTDSATTVANLPRGTMTARLYGTDPAPPYSIHTFYRELSDDRLRVNGTVFNWTRVSGDDTVYEGGCNGLCSNGDIPGLIRQLVQAHDDTVDYGQFDNDGPDGIPNSGDDDGIVDAIVLIHPEVDGACGNVTPPAVLNVWAHRWSYAARAGAPLATADGAAGGGFIRVNDYIIQGGQGGDGGCTADEPVAMGIVAHESGHLLGLPDLYDVNGITAGIGFWGLMGSGNWNKANSPAHMGAWSRAQLGWVTEIVVPRDTTIELSPIESSDTAFVVPIADSDEYFLLENRQRLGSDVNLKAPGLLVWHVDSARIASRWASNTINGFLPHGLALEQADGRSDMLGSASSRGDSGDPFPGSTGNTVFAGGTDPSSARNDGSASYVAVDSIRQIPASLTMSTRIRSNPIRIFATDTNAVFQLDSQEYRVFTDLLEPGSPHQLEMDSVQLVNGDRSRFEWLAWSNGLPRAHTYTATGGDTIIADVAAEHLLRAQVSGPGGGVTASPAVDYVGGEFLEAGTIVQLVAAVSLPDHIFEGWTGDTTASAATLQLGMQRPYDVAAVFAAPLAVVDGTPTDVVMGAQYSFTFSAAGGVDAKTWSVVSGTLPPTLRLWSDGVLSGRPEETGTFPLTVRVVSGTQSVQFPVQLEVVAPALVAGDVVAHVTGVGQTLSADEITYLDLVGNRNQRLDVGDFLAWVETTGGAVSAEQMRRVLQAAGKEQP